MGRKGIEPLTSCASCIQVGPERTVADGFVLVRVHAEETRVVHGRAATKADSGSLAAGEVVRVGRTGCYPVRRPPGNRSLPGGVTGYRTASSYPHRAVRVGPPSSSSHCVDVPRPLCRRVLRRCSSGSTRLPRLSPIRARLGALSWRSRHGRLCFMLRTVNWHDPKGRLSSRFDAGLSTDAGDQLPAP